MHDKCTDVGCTQCACRFARSASRSVVKEHHPNYRNGVRSKGSYGVTFVTYGSRTGGLGGSDRPSEKIRPNLTCSLMHGGKKTAPHRTASHSSQREGMKGLKWMMRETLQTLRYHRNTDKHWGFNGEGSRRRLQRSYGCSDGLVIRYQYERFWGML